MKITPDNCSKEPEEMWYRPSNDKMGMAKTSNFKKFKLLMWKNWLLQKRRKIQTILEIVLSVVFCILLVVIRDLAPSETYSKPTFFKSFSIAPLPNTLGTSQEGFLTTLVNYVFGDSEDISRRKREIEFNDGEALNLLKDGLATSPKVVQFLQKNPTKKSFVSKFLKMVDKMCEKRSTLLRRSFHKRKRRNKRNIFASIFSSNVYWPLAFTPNNSVTQELMDSMENYLDETDSDVTIDTQGYGFETEEEMVKHLTIFTIDPEEMEENRFYGVEDILGGIVFTNEFPNNGSLPKEITYKIRLKGTPRSGKKIIALAPPPRWNTEITYPLFQAPGPRQKTEHEGGNPGYYNEGFLALQFALDKAIAKHFNGTEIDSWANVKLQRMPYPPYIDDKYLVALQAWLPLIILLSYLYPAINIVKSVVYEKEKKLKESMKMMGLSSWLHWCAWFTKSLIMLIMTTSLVTLLLCTRWNGEGSLAVLDNSDPSLVFFFLFVYSCTSISFCFFLSTLFSKANVGATVAGVIWMFSYLPNIFLRPRFVSLSTSLKIGLCLYFNMAMSFGCFLASMFEGVGAGLQWHLISSGVSPDSPFSIADVLGLMVVDMIFYFILTWYIEAVCPGEFGVPQPWYFPFKKAYWFGSDPSSSTNGVFSSATSGSFFETEPVHLSCGIRVKGLTKAFNKGKIAVNKMKLNMYNGQITALLGHNGAGKTTTMSMLTGLFPPSLGTAEVNGFDIVSEMDSVRSSIGICPQHDVLFDELTVAEHITFFSQLKGLEGKKVNEEIKYLLSAVRLMDKKHAMAKTLSGGMKRKLSVSIALCAGSRVVILDEPTTGMDPGARRVIWDLLQLERNGRTILLTTHFMEEADLLGDRIAIMANGVVHCCGSSMFLKRIYGAGYYLTFVKDKNCNVEAITNLIVSYIPEAELELNVAAELTYILPNENISKFEILFNEIEKRREELYISSYGASQTTMEEVFLRVGEESSHDNDDLNQVILRTDLRQSNKSDSIPERGLLLNEDYETIELGYINGNAGKNYSLFTAALQHLINGNAINGEDKSAENDESMPPTPTPIVTTTESTTKNDGAKLILQQFWAMLVKKALFSARNLGLTITQILIPILFLIVAMVILRNVPGVADSPPALKTTFDPFGFISTPFRTADDRSNPSLFSSAYNSHLNGSKNTILNVDQSKNMSNILISKASENIHAFNLHWLAALDVYRDSYNIDFSEIIGYFNNQPYHIPPIVLNLIDQALVQMSTNMSDITITTYNHPLPRNDTEKLTQEARQNMGFNIGFNLAFGFSFLSASFILFLVRERSCNCKHLQVVSGVNYIVYWATTALWDFMCFLIAIILIIVCLVVYDEDSLNGTEELSLIFLILVMYAWAILPFMYISSFLFIIPSTGFIGMAMIHLFIGMSSLITTTILRIPDLELSHIADLLDWIYMLFPPYAMASAITELYTNVRFTKICKKNIITFLCGFGSFENPCCRATNSCGAFGCVLWNEYTLGWEKLGIGRMLVYLALEGILFYLVIAMIELKLFRSIKYYFRSVWHKIINSNLDRRNTGGSLLEEIDDDDHVKAERERIQSASLERLMQTDKLIIRDLTKVYPGGITAVDHINLGVPLGECFGLLGINGAGKTSLFKMLTGDLPVTSGDAYVGRFSIKSNIKKVQQEVGYCPQFDAVLDQMTGRETLRMFGRLRGVPEEKLENDIKRIANQLLLTQHLDKLVGKYSGGNKRKLSTGIALMGDPPLLLLDEPTSGMDPVARRHLWRVLNSVRDAGRGIILTSHSMEECEALCTRLAIMTNGKFRCLGSPQQLKSKFSEGYSLIIRVHVQQVRSVEDSEIKVMPPEMLRVQNFILSTFKKSYLREMQWGRLEYFIPVFAASWSNVFGILEANKTHLQIQDYSVTQTTLERVFLNFTRNQRPENT